MKYNHNIQQPLLSICIPTYNHPNDLRRLLKSIESQMGPEVEIIIRDDSPNLLTAKVVDEFSSRLPISYFHGEKIGLDGAIIFISEKAKGKYVWWIGDNDEVRWGAIKRILNIVREHPQISFIWANFIVVGLKTPAGMLGNSKFFKDGNEVIEKFAILLGFISGSVFRKKELINGVEEAKRFMGTAYVNLYLTLNVIAQGGKKYFFEEPAITCNPTPVGEHFYDGFMTFGIYYYRIVKEFEGKFKKKSIRKMLAKNFGHVWRGILVGWLRGHDTPKGKLWPMFELYWSFPEFWLAAPFFIMPKFFTKLAYFIYKRLLGRAYDR